MGSSLDAASWASSTTGSRLPRHELISLPIEAHVSAILDKVGVSDRTDAMTKSMRSESRLSEVPILASYGSSLADQPDI